MAHQVDPLASSLEIAGAFSSQVNTGVPVELVEAENQSVEAVLASNNNGGQQGGVPNQGGRGVRPGEEPMDITVEGDQNFDRSQISKSRTAHGASAVSGGEENALATALYQAMNSATRGVSGDDIQVNPGSILSNLSEAVKQRQNASVRSAMGVSQTTNIPGVGQVPLEQMSQSLTGHQALEISADAISSLPDNLDQLSSSGRAREMFNNSMNYSGLNISEASSGGILNEQDTPSSPESNFDSSDLLSSSLLQQQDEVTQRLASSGMIGMAAAAAIMSTGRKRKRSMTFETNPSLRKRHCSKLTKKLKETIEELSLRVGLQAAVIMYKPGKSNSATISSRSETQKCESSFKVFGAAPLTNVVKNQKDAIVAEMEAALHQQTPSSTSKQEVPTNESVHTLPQLIFDGIPTPVHKMTQAQLRTFIPNMLKFATGRGKPGWGKDDVKPVWWPVDVPWANVRSDIRTDEQKKNLPWTDALRRIVISCYIHYNRIDLLPEFSIEHLKQIFSQETTDQLQMQLASIQAAANAATTVSGSTESTENVSVTATPTDTMANTESGETSRQNTVFTVDTGMGGCDTAGMPTLADDSLAETAARLQQVADETGEVQYATQTVTVTERDAKALGQPVGSTTTVLLTAYPGGHNGQAAATSGDDTATTSTTTMSTGDHLLSPTQTSDIQVVLRPPRDSAMNVANDNIPKSVSQSIDSFAPSSTGVAAVEGTGIVTTSGTGSMAPSTSMAMTESNLQVMGNTSSATPIVPQAPNINSVVGSEYLNPTSGQDVMMGISPNEGDAPTDLAAELINRYAGNDPSDVAAAFDMKPPGGTGAGGEM